MTPLLLLFGGVLFIQVVFWGGVARHAFRPDPTYPRPQVDGPAGVSVIVCFRNEAPHLETLTTALLAQDHSNFELLFIDDNSSDGGGAQVQRVAGDDERVRVLQPGPTRPGKKDALTFGIQQAKYEQILLTDADCLPQSPDWIRQMSAPLTHDRKLVLGVSPYAAAPGWLNAWQRYEATYVAFQYVGFARRGLPYMGVGRNLAYTRRLFRGAGGFTSHADLPGGDDDLFVGAVAESKTTAVVTEPEGWTVSAPTTDWRTYLRQKLRHQSTGTRYPLGRNVLLTGLAVSHGLFYLLGFLLLFTPLALFAISIYLARMVIVLGAFEQPIPRLFRGEASAWQVPLFDMALCFYYPIVAFGLLFGKRRW